ncbi:hypothetical protein [Alistipes putredinis]|uniref:hypothetical protein n=1 Tax=Alistipes putredinis TaxID=28117 RepID=UPI003AAE1A33
MTENKVAELDTALLKKKAVAIRDAVMAKSVTAEQVGSLFVELIDTCGSVRDALALFLDTNVGEITSDIDRRLSGADEAREAAEVAAQKANATRALVEELVGKLSSQNLYQPTRIDVKSPTEITVSNMAQPRIEAQTLPKFGLGGVLFIGDNKALEVTPDGRITPLAVGVSKVNVVASGNTRLFKQLLIAVVPPRMRMAEGNIRLDGSGNIRLT